MLESPLELDVAFAPPLTETLDGVTPIARKPVGYVRVIASGAASAPPAVGVKLKVTGTFDMLATRKESAIKKLRAVAVPPMYPDGVLTDVKRS